MKEIFDGNFNNILLNANVKYQLRKEKYGESWKDMSIMDLKVRLYQEISEFRTASNNKEQYNELIDIINISLMLSKKLDEEARK